MSEVIETAGAAPQPGRNDPCPCGAGRKWKRCHGDPAGPPDGAAAIFTGRGPGVRGARAWDGEPRRRDDCVAVLDAGAGDAIHAMRHVERVESSFARVTWVLRRDMAGLFRASFPGARVATEHPLPEANWRVGSLWLVGLVSRERARPYLRAPRPAARWGYGLCARGDRTQAFDRWRSVHDEADLEPLYRVPGLWARLDAPGAFRDWAETAAAVAGAVAVVSVDTGVAHLAGALGAPLVMLDRAPGPGDPGPDDRWEEGLLQPGPLYRGAVRVRQRSRGAWREAAAEAARVLEARLR